MTETKESPPLPTIHLNGTSKETLIEGYSNIIENLDKLSDSISSCEFHSRDYYVHDVDAFSNALRERNKHINNISEFAQYIEKHIQDIANQ